MIVSFEHCLYGGTVVMKNPSSTNFSSRNLRYCVTIVTGHRFGFGGKDLKIKGLLLVT